MAVQDLIVAAAQSEDVDPRLALAVAQQESGLNPNARGRAGEVGVFQLLPSTAAQLGVNPYDVGQNIQGGVHYLRTLIDQFGDLAAALAAYNWGLGRVEQAIANYGEAWMDHAPASTQAYVASILGSAAPAGDGEIPTFRVTVYGNSGIPAWLWVLLAVLGLVYLEERT